MVFVSQFRSNCSWNVNSLGEQLQVSPGGGGVVVCAAAGAAESESKRRRMVVVVDLNMVVELDDWMNEVVGVLICK